MLHYTIGYEKKLGIQGEGLVLSYEDIIKPTDYSFNLLIQHVFIEHPLLGTEDTPMTKTSNAFAFMKLIF